MKLTQREERYLKKLLRDRVFSTNGWITFKQENRIASCILDKIEIDKVLRNWDKDA